MIIYGILFGGIHSVLSVLVNSRPCCFSEDSDVYDIDLLGKQTVINFNVFHASRTYMLLAVLMNTQ